VGLVIAAGAGMFGWSAWSRHAGVEDLELKAKYGPLFAFQPVDPMVQMTMKNYEPDPAFFERLETHNARGYTICTLKKHTSSNAVASQDGVGRARHRWEINKSQNMVDMNAEDWPEPLSPTWRDVRRLEKAIVEQIRKETIELNATEVSMERCFVRGLPAYRTTMFSRTPKSGPGGTAIAYDVLTHHRVSLMGVCTEPRNSEECRLLDTILLTVYRPTADPSPLLAKPSSKSE